MLRRFLPLLVLFAGKVLSQEAISSMPSANLPLTGNELATLVQQGWSLAGCPNVGNTGLCNVQVPLLDIFTVPGIALVNANLGKPSYIDLTNAINVPQGSLAPCAPYQVLANNTGSSAAPICTSSLNIASIVVTAGGSISATGAGSIAATSLPGTATVFAVQSYPFNAACNANTATPTDDTAAWQAAINAAGAYTVQSGTPFPVVIKGCDHGLSKITSTLDFTTNHLPYIPAPTPLIVDMSGMCLLASTTGTAAIDASGVHDITWIRPCVKSAVQLSSAPSIGMQFGRLRSSQPADEMYFDHPDIEGYFTFTAVYNAASETNTFVFPRFSNGWVASGASTPTYAMVMDGYNYWGFAGGSQSVPQVTSLACPVSGIATYNVSASSTATAGTSFAAVGSIGATGVVGGITGSLLTTSAMTGGLRVGDVISWSSGAQTATILSRADSEATIIANASNCMAGAITSSSFNGNKFIGGHISNNATATNNVLNGAIWAGNIHGVRFESDYIVSDANAGIIWYTDSSAGSTNNDDDSFDVHMEPSSLLFNFLLTGTKAVPVFNDFKYRDNESFAATAIVSIDTASSITSATFNNLEMKVSSNQGGNVPNAFDETTSPLANTSWKLSGDVQLPSGGQWDQQYAFSGRICSISNDRCDWITQPVAGKHNMANGYGALAAITTGDFNTAFGLNALHAETTGAGSTAFGWNSLLSENVAGAANTAFGNAAGEYISTGQDNVAVGYEALQGATGAKITGGNNTAIGTQSLSSCGTTCNSNTAIGYTAGNALTTGTFNTILGLSGFSTLTTGSNNILIGYQADTSSGSASYETHINNGSGDVLHCTGGNTPSTSACTFAGTLAPTGGTVGVTNGATAAAGTVGEVYSINCVVGAAGAAATAVTTPVASPGVVTWTSPPWSASANNTNWTCPINFTTAGALPTGLTVGTTYYIIGSTYSAGTFQVATTVANALSNTPINFTGSTSGQSSAYIGVLQSSVNNYTGAGFALAAGDWDCHGLAEYQELTALTSSRYIAGISTSLTLGAIGTYSQDVTVSGSVASNSEYWTTPTVEQNLSTGTGVYLNIGASFSAGSMNGAGTFYCRRAR